MCFIHSLIGFCLNFDKYINKTKEVGGLLDIRGSAWLIIFGGRLDMK
jgi:hypothetical protein